MLSVNNKQFFLISGTIILIAVLASGCGGTTVAAPDQIRTISVSGSGEVSSAPDMAKLDLGFRTRNQELEAAIEESNQTVASITAALADLGIEEKDIQTRNFNVWFDERYDDDGNPTGVTIYEVSNSVNVTIRDIAIIGDVISAGLGAGANNVNGLSFGIDDDETLRAEARQQAIDDAYAQAAQLAEGLGMNVGDPIAISEGVTSTPVMRNGIEMAMADAAFGGGAVPISEGELNIYSNVSIVYELVP